MISLDELFGQRLNVTVLRLFSQVEGGMSGNAVARRLGLQQSAARKALERLVTRGVLTRTEIGRTASYALDSRREIVRRIVIPVFRAEVALGQMLRVRLHGIAQQLRPAPAAVILYGSVARGERAPGDVDLLVVLHRAADAEPLRSALLDAVEPVERRFQVAINPVVLSVDDVDTRATDPLIESVVADGLLLSGRATGPLRRVRRFVPPEPSPSAAESDSHARTTARTPPSTRRP